jgi:hypothetical protein
VNILRNITTATFLILAATGCASTTHSPATHAITVNIGGHKGDIGQPDLPCRPTDIATMAVAAPGVAVSSIASLNPAPLTVVTDTSGGELAFYHSAVTLPSDVTALFTSTDLVAADPGLQSCDYLLSDRPAAQPFIQAAISAAVSRDLAPPAAVLSASVSGVEIGDNPVTPGSLVVILLVTGAPQGSVAGHIVYGPYTSIFVLMNRDTISITGVGHGTW